jgi:hypothetical protein
MKTLIPAAMRCSLMFTAVAVLSLAYPASVQAVPTTYHYTGNPYTDVSGSYTTSMFVTAMVTLAAPLPPNFSGTVTPTAFRFFDGVQTLTNTFLFQFFFTTGPTGEITSWSAQSLTLVSLIETLNRPFEVMDEGSGFEGFGFNKFQPGRWVVTVPDSGTTLSLMTLTFMALGIAARRFKWAAA